MEGRLKCPTSTGFKYPIFYVDCPGGLQLPIVDMGETGGACVYSNGTGKGYQCSPAGGVTYINF